MTEIELKDYIQTNFPKEDNSCEWKEFKNLRHNISGSEGKDLISYVSGISNMEGGEIIIGVEDDTCNIIGIENLHDFTPENLPQRLIGNCSNLSSEDLYVQDIATSDTKKTLWIIHVPKHMPRRPVLAHKKAWQRCGDSLIEMTQERQDAILAEQMHFTEDWSAEICPDATIHDLDEEAILIARDNFLTKFPHLTEQAKSWDNETFLNKARLSIKKKITRTAILLLGKPESVHYLKPANTMISWILKDGNNTELDYEHFGLPFLLNVNKVFFKIRNLKYRYIKDDTLFPEEVTQYEPYVVREALHNCIAHQDYSMGGRINIVEMPDELIFTNSGNFIPGSVEQVIEQDAPTEVTKNPFLTNAMLYLNMIDTIGSGIKRMFHFQKDRFFPLPEYDFSSKSVKLTIIGKVLDLSYARVLARNPDLSLSDILMLDKLQKGKDLRDNEIKYLRSMKFIEGRKPNFYISSRVAEKTGQKADYIKKRGLKDQHYKKLILEYLDQYKQAGRQDIEMLLIDILPDVLTEQQKKNKVKNLISSMSRYDQTIINIGTNRKSIWIKNV